MRLTPWSLGLCISVTVAATFCLATEHGTVNVVAPQGKAVPATIDLLRDRESWTSTGWRFRSEDRKSPAHASETAALQVQYCCTGGGMMKRALPVAAGQYEVRIRYRNTECRRAVVTEVLLEDDLSNIPHGVPDQSLASANLDGAAEFREETLAFVADHLPSETVVLKLTASGGLSCCGSTFVESITLAVQPRTLPAPKLCRHCRQCIRRLLQAEKRASAEGGEFGVESIYVQPLDQLWSDAGSNLTDDGSSGVVLLMGRSPQHNFQVYVVWDHPSVWIDPREHGGPSRACSAPASLAKKNRRAPPAVPHELWLQRHNRDAFGILAGCGNEESLTAFRQHFTAAVDACLPMAPER
jgi:hypothetical protein